MSIQFHFLDGDVSPAHASSFSAADGRQEMDRGEGGRGEGKGAGRVNRPRCDLVQFMNSAGGQSEKEKEREKDNSNLGENLEAAQSVKVSRRNRRGRNMSLMW